MSKATAKSGAGREPDAHDIVRARLNAANQKIF
jgi:hypothetical protein